MYTMYIHKNGLITQPAWQVHIVLRWVIEDSYLSVYDSRVIQNFTASLQIDKG